MQDLICESDDPSGQAHAWCLKSPERQMNLMHNLWWRDYTVVQQHRTQRIAFASSDWVRQVLCSPRWDLDIPKPFSEEFPSRSSHKRLQSVLATHCVTSLVSVCVCVYVCTHKHMHTCVSVSVAGCMYCRLLSPNLPPISLPITKTVHEAGFLQ
jgi:hypothetical protein